MASDKKIKKLLEETEKEYFGIYETEISDRELEFFSTPPGKKFIETEEKIYNAGLGKYLSLSLPTKKEARKLPKKSGDEILFREKMIKLSTEIEEAGKIASKYFKDGLREFDPNVFDVLTRAGESTDSDIENARSELARSLKSDDKSAAEKARRELKKCLELKKSIIKQLNKAEKVCELYLTASKPYFEAKHLVRKLEKYGNDLKQQ